MLCVSSKFLSHVSAKRERERERKKEKKKEKNIYVKAKKRNGFQFRTFMGVFQMTW